MVFLQVCIGAYTRQSKLVTQLNPCIHLILITASLYYSEADISLFTKEVIASYIFALGMVLLYIYMAFKTLNKLLEQKLEQELCTHRQTTAIFNSLQEGILIAKNRTYEDSTSLKVVF